MVVFALLLIPSRSLSVLHEDLFSAPIDMKRAHFHSKSLYISRAVSNFHRTKFDIWAGFESVDSTAPVTAEDNWF